MGVSSCLVVADDSGMRDCTDVCTCVCVCVGIGPKVTQSVLTAAFLFAFKDALYDMTIKARRSVAAKRA